VPGPGDVARVGQQPVSGLVQPELLLELDRVIDVSARKCRWNEVTLIVASAARSCTRSVWS
jgi:hypothetical protein